MVLTHLSCKYCDYRNEQPHPASASSVCIFVEFEFVFSSVLNALHMSCVSVIISFKIFCNSSCDLLYSTLFKNM